MSYSTPTEAHKRWRTKANAYYWAVMLPTFARELFHDVQFRSVHLNLIEVHLRLKWEMLPFGDDPNLRIEEQVRSTSVSKMPDEDFRDYLNRLSMFAAERGIEFPSKRPDEETTTV